MRARSPCIWLFLLLACWATIVASKSVSVTYERMLLFYAYRIAFMYKGASQSYILRHLDPVKDAVAWKASYNQLGNRGSLPDGQLTWKEFQLAIDPGVQPTGPVPELDETDFDRVAAGLRDVGLAEREFPVRLAQGLPPNKNGGKPYHEYVSYLREMVVEARANIGDSKILSELEHMKSLSKEIVDIRKPEMMQVQFLGTALQERFPGINIKTKLFHRKLDPANVYLDLVDLRATLDDPQNKANMPKSLGLKDGEDWRKPAMKMISKYGLWKPGMAFTRTLGHGRMVRAWRGWRLYLYKPVCKP